MYGYHFAALVRYSRSLGWLTASRLVARLSARRLRGHPVWRTSGPSVATTSCRRGGCFATRQERKRCLRRRRGSDGLQLRSDNESFGRRFQLEHQPKSCCDWSTVRLGHGVSLCQARRHHFRKRLLYRQRESIHANSVYRNQISFLNFAQRFSR